MKTIFRGQLHLTTQNCYESMLFTKTMRIVQVTAFLLTVFSLTVTARSVSQTITYTAKDVPLSTVFSVIKQQTGYLVAGSVDQLDLTYTVTVDAKEQALTDFLHQILIDQPCSFDILSHTIFIRKKTEKTFSTLNPPPTPPITGVVRGPDGKGIPGVNVMIKGKKKGTVTDSNGNFSIDTNPEDVLSISSIGYVKKEINVINQSAIVIDLLVSTSPLDEVQVIAYGEQSQRLSVGNVTTVTSKDIEKQPVSNPILALEGRVPGLFIQQSNGIAGGGLTVRIQGQNSIGNGNEPFYIVDGVPYSSKNLQSYSYVAGGSPLNFINPSDIETISVLKDADATAIYGSRAANGAIIITTKKGKAGATKVDFDLQQGFGKVTRTLPVLNTQEYLQMRHEALKNDGLTVAETDWDINGTWDTTRYTDWQKTLIGGTAQYTNLYASLSGGNANTQYLVGATYHRESSVFPGDFANQKASLHFSQTSSSVNNKFKFQLTGNYTFDNNEIPGTDYTQAAFLLAPDAPPLYNADGSLNWALDQNGNTTWINPVSNGDNPLFSIYNKYVSKVNNLISNAVVSYQLLPDLEIKSSFGYTNQQVNESSINPLISVAPANRPYTPRFATYSRNSSNSWIVEPQINYKKQLGEGKLDFLIGITIQQLGTNVLNLSGLGYNSDLVMEDLASAASLTSSTAISVYKYNALFGRLSYNWNDKYILNVTGRRDGSSRFGPESQFHNFGSVGAAWLFSNEKPFENSFSSLSFGKLSATYGTTGNDQIGDYTFLSLYYPLGGYIPYQGTVPVYPNQLTNPFLQWESTTKISVGLDLGFLKDRILIKGTYYRNRSSNQLLAYELPYITGFSSIAKNFPATVQNSGLEATLNTVNIKTKTFSWTTSISLTVPKNKLISFPDLANSSYGSQFEIGKSTIGASKVYRFLGVNDTTGVYQFADSKGNTTSNPVYGTDNTVFISQSPKYYGGVENVVTYKRLELSFLFQFVKQTGTTYPFGHYYPGNLYAGNQPVWVLDRWQKPGDHTNVQRFGNGNNLTQIGYATYSDGFYTDASFMRLKNLAITYSLPEKWLSQVHVQSCRVSVRAQNLLTITNYKGLDPELPQGPYAGLPPLRVITAGLQCSL